VAEPVIPFIMGMSMAIIMIIMIIGIIDENMPEKSVPVVCGDNTRQRCRTDIVGVSICCPGTVEST